MREWLTFRRSVSGQGHTSVFFLFLFFAECKAFLQHLHNSVKLSSLMDHRQIQTAAGKINIIIIPAVLGEGEDTQIRTRSAAFG